jgi:Staphylococcal nuclease homologue
MVIQSRWAAYLFDLFGIDAPEGRQSCERNGQSYACGKEATKELSALIAGQPVQCEIVGRDQYARALGVCTVGSVEINKTMLRPHADLFDHALAKSRVSRRSVSCS